MSAELNKLKDHLGDLELFMASPAHVGYIAARRQDIRDIEGRILMIRPVSAEDIGLLNQAHGERDYASDMLKTFEDARAVLKKRIDEMAEAENESAQNTKV